MSRGLRAALVALVLPAPLPALGAERASAIALQPVPWVEAGTGDPIGFDELWGFSIRASCAAPGGPHGCADASGAEEIELPVAPGSEVALDTGTFRFSAGVVSRLVGDAWEVGLEDVSLETPPRASFPQPPAPGELVSLAFWLHVPVHAVFDVPVVDGAPTTALSFGSEPRLPVPNFASGLLGPGSGLEYGTVETFVAGDRITLVEEVVFGVQWYAPFGQDWQVCNGTVNGPDTCPGRITVGRIAAVPEPQGLVLALVSALGLAGFRRRRG